MKPSIAPLAAALALTAAFAAPAFAAKDVVAAVASTFTTMDPYDAFPPKMFNTAYYKNDAVDTDIAKALNTTSSADKTKQYADAQQRIWKNAPWGFLVTEQLLSAHSTKVSGFYVMPDASFNFDEVDLK
jgi:hypothetical protein